MFCEGIDKMGWNIQIKKGVFFVCFFVWFLFVFLFVFCLFFCLFLSVFVFDVYKSNSFERSSLELVRIPPSSSSEYFTLSYSMSTSHYRIRCLPKIAHVKSQSKQTFLPLFLQSFLSLSYIQGSKIVAHINWC